MLHLYSCYYKYYLQISNFPLMIPRMAFKAMLHLCWKNTNTGTIVLKRFTTTHELFPKNLPRSVTILSRGPKELPRRSKYSQKVPLRCSKNAQNVPKNYQEVPKRILRSSQNNTHGWRLRQCVIYVGKIQIPVQ